MQSFVTSYHFLYTAPFMAQFSAKKKKLYPPVPVSFLTFSCIKNIKDPVGMNDPVQSNVCLDFAQYL